MGAIRVSQSIGCERRCDYGGCRSGRDHRVEATLTVDGNLVVSVMDGEDEHGSLQLDDNDLDSLLSVLGKLRS